MGELRTEGSVLGSAATQKRNSKVTAENPNGVVMVPKKKVKKKKDDGKQDPKGSVMNDTSKPQKEKVKNQTKKENPAKQKGIEKRKSSKLITEQHNLKQALGLGLVEESPVSSAEKTILSSGRSSPLEAYEESKARSSSSDMNPHPSKLSFKSEGSEKMTKERDHSEVLPASPASKLTPVDLNYKQTTEFITSDADNSPLSPSKFDNSRINTEKDQLQPDQGNAPSGSTVFALKPQLIEATKNVEEGQTEMNQLMLRTKQERNYQVNPDQLPDAVPLYPKQLNFVYGPPKCPLDGVKFMQLKRFYNTAKSPNDVMNSGFELVGQRRKLINLRTKEKIDKKENGGKLGEAGDAEAKMDATTHFIKNIVYARDPTILDRETLHVNQRAAFSHENMLDVKKMMHKSQALQHDDQMNYRMAALQRSPMIRRPNQQQAPKPRPLDCQIVNPVDENDKTLMFESRFESGNLYLAQKVSDGEYNLLMQNDVNTCGHTQWFFFRVQNTKANHKVKFNILNYSKPDSLFNYGMKVSVYSDRHAEEKKVGWHKGGEDISYFSNGIRKDVLYSSKSFYTATFTYKFKYSGDSIYFAYSQPYTYSELRDDLAAIDADPDRTGFVTRKNLCTTLAGNPCEYLTITSKKKDKDVLELGKRKGVIITARVHPGETVGSHMMKGVLQFLTHPTNKEAQILRENFVFKVIPMLNPDGVINGNYRCSLAGCDLNRRWKAPSKLLHPTVYYTKKLIKQIHEERGVIMFCDLHGHSRKQNVFMYGCNKKDNPGLCRAFPYLMSKINPYFSFEYSRFGVQKSKESTARVAMFKELRNVPCIYTMESSFAGLDMGKAAGQHFTSEMLQTIGKDLTRSILAYQNLYVAEELKELPMFKRRLEQKELGQKEFAEDAPNVNIFDAILEEFNQNKDLLEQGDGESSSGSDDMPSEDNLPAEVIVKQLPPEKVKPEPKLVPKKEPVKKQQNDRQRPVPLKKPDPLDKARNEPSPQRKMIPLLKKEEPVVEVKPEETKKTKLKVETKDAWTQTEKSATAEYKAKLQREKARLAAQQVQQQDQLKNPHYYTTQQTSIKSRELVQVQSKNSNPVLSNANTLGYSQLKGANIKQGMANQKLYNPGQQQQPDQINQAQFNQSPQNVMNHQMNKNGAAQPTSQSQQNGFFSLNQLNKRQVGYQPQLVNINGQNQNVGFNQMQKAQIEMQQRAGAGGGFSQPPRSQRENQIQGIRNINHGHSNTDRTQVPNNTQQIQNALSQQSVVQNSFGKGQVNQLDMGKNHPVIMSNNMAPNPSNSSSSNFQNFVSQNKPIVQHQQRQKSDMHLLNSVQGQSINQNAQNSFNYRPSGKQIVLIDKKVNDFTRREGNVQYDEPESPATYAKNFKNSVMKNYNKPGEVTVPTSQFLMNSQQSNNEVTQNSSTKLITQTTNPNSITPQSDMTINGQKNSSYRQKQRSTKEVIGTSNAAKRQHQQAIMQQLKQGGEHQQQRQSHPQTGGNGKGQSWAPVLRTAIESQGLIQTPVPVSHTLTNHTLTAATINNNFQNLGVNGASNLRASHNRTQSLNSGPTEISKFNKQAKTNPNGLLAATLNTGNLQSRTKLPVLDGRHQPKDNSSTHGGSVKAHRPSENGAIHDITQQLSMQKRMSASNYETQPTPQRANNKQAKLSTKTPISSTGKNPTSVDIVQMSKYEEGVLKTPGNQKKRQQNTSDMRVPQVQINAQLGKDNERAQSSPARHSNK